MHHKLGVRAAHMPIMKGLLLSTLRAAAADLFSASVEAAWGFVWYSHARARAHTHMHTHTFACTHTSARTHDTGTLTHSTHTYIGIT